MKGRTLIIMTSILGMLFGGLLYSCKPSTLSETNEYETEDDVVRALDWYDVSFYACLEQVTSGSANTFMLYINPKSAVKQNTVKICLGELAACKSGGNGLTYIAAKASSRFNNISALETTEPIQIQENMKITILGMDNDDKQIGNTVQFNP